MSRVVYVRFYSSDWRSGCIGLSVEEEGLYVRICARFYEVGRRLPLDDKDAATSLMMDVRQYRRIREKLIAKGKLYVAEDGYGNRRAEHERKLAEGDGKEAPAADLGAARNVPAERQNGRVAGARHDTREDAVEDVAGEVAETSVGLRDDFPETSPRLLEKVCQKAEQNQSPFRESELEAKRKKVTPLPPEGGGDALQAFEVWNQTALKAGLQQSRSLTPDRRRKLTARLRECGGLEGWRQAMANILASEFLRGKNERGWRANLDFVLQPTSFGKLCDGVYGAALEAPRTIHGHKAMPAYWWRGREDQARAVSTDTWRTWIGRYANGKWPEDQLGPSPGSTDCLVPAALVAELGLARKYAIMEAAE